MYLFVADPDLLIISMNNKNIKKEKSFILGVSLFAYLNMYIRRWFNIQTNHSKGTFLFYFLLTVVDFFVQCLPKSQENKVRIP